MPPDTVQVPFRLKNPPIVEAVLDIDCDLPADFNIEAINSDAAAALAEEYPKAEKQFLHQAGVTVDSGAGPKFTIHGDVKLQFFSEDKKQAIQFRRNGFSFNRLAPYQDFSDYLPSIAKSWDHFVRLAKPSVVRRIALRYINRIQVPGEDGKVYLPRFFSCAPTLPNKTSLEFISFINQYEVQDSQSGNQANIILTSEEFDGARGTFILDIEVFSSKNFEAASFTSFADTIKSLRSLKNTIFENSLTPECLSFFQQ
jgi:uncharacterized protein (TIGR04255 family)